MRRSKGAGLTFSRTQAEKRRSGHVRQRAAVSRRPGRTAACLPPCSRASDVGDAAGIRRHGESDELSAEPELEEETGLGVQPQGIRSLGFMVSEASLLAARIHLFCAERCFRKWTCH